jgi:hypothetical protein
MSLDSQIQHKKNLLVPLIIKRGSGGPDFYETATATLKDPLGYWNYTWLVKLLSRPDPL